MNIFFLHKEVELLKKSFRNIGKKKKGEKDKIQNEFLQRKINANEERTKN